MSIIGLRFITFIIENVQETMVGLGIITVFAMHQLHSIGCARVVAQTCILLQNGVCRCYMLTS